jgi:hypothetical protein
MPIDLGCDNYETLKQRVCIFNYERKVISGCTKAWLKEGGAPSIWETYSSKMGLPNIWNLEHRYGTTKMHFFKKVDGAQSSINKRPIPLKEIDNQAWHPSKGPKINSHDPRPMLSLNTYKIFLSKLTKRNLKKKRWIVQVKKESRWMTHEDKLPNATCAFPKEENNWYVPWFEIMTHLKNVWQNPQNPLAHPKCVNHLWLKCSHE